MAARRKASPKVTKEVDEDAVIAAQRAALHLPIIVGEREGERSPQSICSNRELTYRAGEPNYKKPNEQPASPRSPQQPSADPEDDDRTRRIPLAPVALSILRPLVVARGSVVARDRLVAGMPGAGDEHALEVALSRLRQAIGVPGLIATVVKRGYRIDV